MVGNSKKAIISIILFSLSIILIAQSKVIRINYEMLNIPSSNIYIQDVIDARSNKKFIGYINYNNKTDSINLKNGTAISLDNYLKFILPQDDSKVPIYVEVSNLNIIENKTTNYDSIKAELVLTFYKKTEGFLSFDYKSKAFYSTANKDGLKGFESSLRQCLGICLTDYINVNKINTQNKTEQIQIKDSNQISNIKQENSSNQTDESIVRDYMLTYTNKQGINATGFTVSFYSYFNKKGNNWIFPGILSIDIFSIKPAYFKQFNYQSAKLNYYMPGICALRKLNDYCWFNLALQIPVGSEVLIDFYGKKTDNIFFGIEPSQGLYFIPKSFGITFGIGLYEKFLTSEVYKSDFGFKAELGVKF